VLSQVEQLRDRMHVAINAGARLVLIPTVNTADFGSIPPELLDRLRVDVHSDPLQTTFKAIAEM
jgi:predicted ATP-dependent Lon-type protease